MQTQVPEAPAASAADDRSATSQKEPLLQAGSSRLRSLLSAGRSPDRDESADTGPKATATAVPDQIVAYWSQLRGARRYPSTADLDAEVIGAKWPNSLLIRCRSGSRALEPERVFSGERGLAASGAPGPSPAKIELSPMMLQWLLGLAGSAVRESRPMEDSETFPGTTSVTYRAFALPLSQDESAIDHVLCHVCRAD